MRLRFSQNRAKAKGDTLKDLWQRIGYRRDLRGFRVDMQRCTNDDIP